MRVFSGLQRPSGALGVSWSLLGPSRASLSPFSFPRTFLGRPRAPGASCSSWSRLVFSGPSWHFLSLFGPSWASWSLLAHPGASGAFSGVLGPPGAYGLPGSHWSLLGFLQSSALSQGFPAVKKLLLLHELEISLDELESQSYQLCNI